VNTWTSIHPSGGEVVLLTTALEQLDRCTLVLYTVQGKQCVQKYSLDYPNAAAAMGAEAGLLEAFQHRCGDECEAWVEKRI
jgi:hypothetical protein